MHRHGPFPMMPLHHHLVRRRGPQPVPGCDSPPYRSSRTPPLPRGQRLLSTGLHLPPGGPGGNQRGGSPAHQPGRYGPPPPREKGKRALPCQYGSRFALNDPSTWPDPDGEDTWDEPLANGRSGAHPSQSLVQHARAGHAAVSHVPHALHSYPGHHHHARGPPSLPPSPVAGLLRPSAPEVGPQTHLCRLSPAL